jgi:alpha-galactosidase
LTAMDPVAVIVDGATAPYREGVVAVGGLEIVVAERGLGSGRRLDVVVRNPGTDVVTVGRVGIRLDGTPTQVLEHGYQSWSCVRPCAVDDVRPERAGNPDWARGTHVSDPEVAGSVVFGDQFLLASDGAAAFLDGRQHLSTVTADGAGLAAWALLDDVPVAPGEERPLDPLWLAAGAPGPLYSELAALWGEEASARVHRKAPIGWCSWYQYFADVTPADIRSNLELAALHGFGLVQIDDGYQSAIGDWLTPRPSWAEGTAALAADIRASGMEAGIWTAPFLAGEPSRLLADHPDWMALHSSGRPMKAAYNPDQWGGFAYALDTTNPAVLDHLRTTYAALTAQGFGYHKIDFCYAAALPARRSDPTKTRGQALRAGLEAVRDGIGDDAFLLGCGCPFGQAVGVVDAMRVSADVAPYWEPVAHWPGFVETAPSALNAIQASVLRAPLHRRVFINDPDCLLLRPTDTGLSPFERSVLTAVVAGCGGFTLLSDDV